MSVEITISYLDPPDSITLYQLNGKNEILTKAEYPPNAALDVIQAAAEADSILLETRKTGTDGNTEVVRTLFQRSDESIDWFACDEDGICIRQSIPVIWGD